MQGLIIKQLIYGHFLEKRQAQDLQNCVERGVDVEPLLDDGDEDISADGNPDMGFHCVLVDAKKRFDAQMLFEATGICKVGQ